MSIELLEKIWPKWKVAQFLGEGTFGKVYKCVHSEHDIEQFSAIKVISIQRNE